MTDFPLSDDDHAKHALQRSAVIGIVRHIVPGGAALGAASWVLVAIGAIRLGAWGWIVVAYFAGALANFVRCLVKAKRVADSVAKKPIREQQEQILSGYRALMARSRWKQLNKGFWREMAIFGIPKAVVVAYAFTAWWSLPVSLAGASVPVAWSFISRLSRNDRIGPALEMMLEPRGPKGLPTPEV